MLPPALEWPCVVRVLLCFYRADYPGPGAALRPLRSDQNPIKKSERRKIRWNAPIPGLADRKNCRKLEKKGAKTMEQKKAKKGTPPLRYDKAFKAGAVGLVTEQGRQPTEVAKELGICIDTLRSWLKTSGIQMGRRAARTASSSASGS